MRVSERQPGDAAELTRRARAERDALQRERYRAVLLALDGREAVAIAAALGRSRRSVQDGSTPTATAGSTTCCRARAPAARPSCHAGARRN